MPNKIHELLIRNLQEVFGEGDATRRRAAIEELYTEDCALYPPPGVLVGHDALDKFAADLRATHLISSIRLTVNRRRCTTLAVSRGGTARVEKIPTTLAWMSLSFAVTRSPRSMFSLMQRRHDEAYGWGQPIVTNS